MKHLKNSQIKISLGILFVYLVLTLTFTYPVILKLNQEIAGLGSDSHQVVATIINNINKYTEQGFLNTFQDIITHLRFDSVSINTYFNYFLGIPLGYNIFWLFSFIAAAFGAYLLTKYILEISTPLTDPKSTSILQYNLPAFMAGLIYAFNPIHIAWAMGFGGSTHIEWIPFTTLFILKFIKKPNFKYFILLSFFFLLLIKGEYHFAAFYLIFLIPFLGYYLYRNREVIRNKYFRRYTLIAILLGVSLIVWVYYPLIKISLSENNYLDPGLDQATRYSNDTLSIITPPFTNNLWGDFFAPIREKFTGNEFEYSAYIGFTVLFLIVIVLIYQKSKDSLFWAFSSFGFYILSMGPFLHFSGLVEPKIPLPYLFLYQYVPFFQNIRSVDRFAIIAVLCIAVTAGFAVHYFLEKFKTVKIKTTLSGLFIFFIIFEYFPLPVPTTSLSYSPFYDQIKEEQEYFSIIEIPGATNYRAASRFRYYQSIHQKRMINTYHFARANPDDPIYIRNQSIPILKELLYQLLRDTDVSSHSAIDTTNPDINTAILNYYNVKYIILHKDYIGNEIDNIKLEDFIKLKKFIENNIYTQEYYQDKELIAYHLNTRTSTSSPLAPLLMFGENWRRTEFDNGRILQWIDNPATLKFENINNQNKAYLTFEVKTASKTQRHLMVTINDEEQATFIVDDSFRQYLVPFPDIIPKKGTISFKVFNLDQESIDSHKHTTVAFSYIALIPFNQVIETTYEDLKIDKLEERILQIPFHGYYSTRADEYILSPQSFITKIPETETSILQNNLPFYKELLFSNKFDKKTLDSGHDIIELSYYQRLWVAFLADSNIKYIIIHKNLLDGKKIENLKQFLTEHLNIISRHENEELLVFEIQTASQEKIEIPNITISNNWDMLERRGEPVQVRKMINDTTIEIYNPFDNLLSANLIFDVRTCRDTRRHLKLYNQFVLIHELDVDWIDYKPQGFPLTLYPGNNIILLKLYDDQDNFLNRDETLKCPLWFSNLSLNFISQ